MIAHPHVEIGPDGPVVTGTRVVVRRLWAWHRGGTSIETLIRRYPNLGPAKVLSALAWAYDNLELVAADLERSLRSGGRSDAPSQPGAAAAATETTPPEGTG